MVFIECKTTFPRAGIRIFSEKHEQMEYESYIKNILQVYKSMKKYCKKGLSSIESCYGVVVNLYDNYIRRSEIYRRIREIDTTLTDEELAFIENHIKCLDVYWIERLCTYSEQLIDEYLYEWGLTTDRRFDYVATFQRSSDEKGLLLRLNNETQTRIESFLNEIEINV